MTLIQLLTGRTSNIKLILFVNGERGIKVLKSLINENINVVGIVWHGNKVTLNDFEGIRNLKLIRNDWKPLENFILEWQPDLGIVSGFSFILPKEILDLTKFGFWNLHAGKIPEYRGGSPLNWQLINGEDEIGISILKMTEHIDDGLIMGQSTFKIEQNDTILDLHNKANIGFSKLICDLLINFNETVIGSKPQPESRASYWHQRSDADGLINPLTQSSEYIERMVRALTKPYPGAWFKIKGEKIRVFKCRLTDKSYKGTPGKILKLRDQNPILITCTGAIELLEVEKDNLSITFHQSDYVD